MTNSKNVSRKDFLKHTALAVGGLSLTSTMMGATSIFEQSIPSQGKIALKNVRLETGFGYENDEVISTKTGLFYIEIENGKITKISDNLPNSKAIDAKSLLMLPAFKDMHIHLDKTIYGDHWQAVRKRTGGVKGMIALGGYGV